jgi:hypothetical protein
MSTKLIRLRLLSAKKIGPCPYRHCKRGPRCPHATYQLRYRNIRVVRTDDRDIEDRITKHAYRRERERLGLAKC